LLKVDQLKAFYGPIRILHDINILVLAGQIIGIVGANAAGKSTLMFSLAGLRTRCTGTISIDEDRIDGLPAYERVLKGLVLVPERRRLFPFMTVLENLEIGAYSQPARAQRHQTLKQVYELLPVLAERRNQEAGSLSGGEQQMLAIGRILRTGARLLLLDEPTEGLAPVIIQQIGNTIRTLKSQGFTILLVEQNFRFASTVADRYYVMEHGRVIDRLANSELEANLEKLHEYLGV
jgi:branched-chain amino acid transport system ATP-binding protein